MHARVEIAWMPRFPIVSIMLLVVATNPAHAVATAALSTFTFTGQCDDCRGTATGTLTLQNYTLGSPFGRENFISFSYDGTNLFMPFTITQSNAVFVEGSINSLMPASENVSIQGTTVSLNTGTPGYWCVGGSCNADFGSSHQWSVAADGAPASVPEPISLGLLGSSLLGLAFLLRRA